MAKEPGWKAAQKQNAERARLREVGMFNDLAQFITEFRLNGGETSYPPEARMRDYLNARGWKAERGGPVSIRTVQEMIRHMDPNLDALPKAGPERIARIDGEFLPGTETMYVGYSPEFWMEYRNAVMGGWKPAARRSPGELDDQNTEDDLGSSSVS